MVALLTATMNPLPEAIAQGDCEASAEVCFSDSSNTTTSPEIGNAPPAAEEPPKDSSTTEPVVEEISQDENEVTAETYTDEQSILAEGITADLKARRLTRPVGNNALQKIRELKLLQPNHDYSVNGENYLANIYLSIGRVALRRGDITRAERNIAAAQRLNGNSRKARALAAAIATKKEALLKDAEETVDPTDPAASLSTQLTTTAIDVTAKPATKSEPEPASKTDNRKIANGNARSNFFAPVMLAIPAGKFVMGSESGANDEKPVHEVAVEAFSISKYEITLEQYAVFATDIGVAAPQFDSSDSTRPMVNVSWPEAVAYARWLGEKTEKAYRLASEAEWEYAARAGTRTPFFTGDDIIGSANCVGCGGEWDDKQTAPVGSFPPNQFGVFDMHGNVWEWVQDCWTDDYSTRGALAEAVELEGCTRRVLRGGSWYNDSDYARSSYRGNEIPGYRDEGVGFRVVHEGL